MVLDVLELWYFKLWIMSSQVWNIKGLSYTGCKDRIRKIGFVIIAHEGLMIERKSLISGNNYLLIFTGNLLVF